jgi:Flp pilus assembly protein TadG
MKKFFKNDSGAAFIMLAIAIPVIIGIFLLTFDLSNRQSSFLDNESGVQSAADSTAEYIAKARLTGDEPSGVEIREFAF